MITNKNFSNLKELLEERDVDFENIADKYKNHKYYEPDRAFFLEHYEKSFKDLHLKMTLESFKENLNIENIYPNNKNYNFHLDNVGRFFVYKSNFSGKSKKKKNTLSNYDNLISVNNFPGVVEFSLSRFPKKLDRKCNILSNILKSKDFGYLILTPESNFQSSLSPKFLRDGGLIAKFNLSKQEFREKLKYSLHKNNLKFLEEIYST